MLLSSEFSSGYPAAQSWQSLPYLAHMLVGSSRLPEALLHHWPPSGHHHALQKGMKPTSHLSAQPEATMVGKLIVKPWDTQGLSLSQTIWFISGLTGLQADSLLMPSPGPSTIFLPSCTPNSLSTSSPFPSLLLITSVSALVSSCQCLQVLLFVWICTVSFSSVSFSLAPLTLFKCLYSPSLSYSVSSCSLSSMLGEASLK